MRITTVSILVIVSIACCNAQRYTPAAKVNVVTTVREGASIPPYLNGESAHRLVKLKPGVTEDEARKNGLNIIVDIGDDWVIVDVTSLNSQTQPKLIEQVQPVNFLWKLSDNLSSVELGTADELVILTEEPAEFVRECI